MGKMIYRLCLIGCLLVALTIGVMLYREYYDGEEIEICLLV
ncbi:MAG: hypothetical protein PUB24_00835 [Lachnospiraceae bacterium]|nr:hypothetical protein [Lachnospiraceae bacterium]